MLTSPEQSPLYKIAWPDSIAWFGASNNINRMGSNLLSSLLGLGYGGRVYPVHPSEKEVAGLKAYPSVADLPEAADLAVIVLPTKIVNQTVEECGRKGIRRVIIVSGGFKEVGGEGLAREAELKSIAAVYGISILGPNGLGVANPHHKLNTTFIPDEGEPGYIGLASHSGSFVTQIFNYLARLGLNFSTAFSLGNEANIDIVDALEYLGVCPHTKVIALYVEGIRRGREFVEAARAISRKKPIVAFYAGGSETGRKAGFSHTGAMAGPDRLYDGIFRQAGIVRAQSITELFDFCWALGSQPLPRGRRVVIQTHSGGPGAAGADACGRAGLDLPALAQSTIERLGEYVPHTGSVNNPVDLTYTKNPLDFYGPIPEVLVNDPNTDMLLIYFLTPVPVIIRTLQHMGVPEDQMEEGIEGFVKSNKEVLAGMLAKTDKPVIGYTWRSREEAFSKALMEIGMPLYPDPQSAARAAAALVRYKELKDKIESDPEG